MLRSRAEAEELLQEVFAELWRRAPEYDADRAAPATWVVTVARSRALDALRARARRGGEHLPVDEASAPASPAEPVDEKLDAAQRSQAVRAALAGLSEVQRQALELAYFDGLSHSEIAERLDVPLGTVKSRIIAGMKVLREALAALQGEKP
jgi:RNA polymerase sigma-70 factor (ECF subfamily)